MILLLRNDNSSNHNDLVMLSILTLLTYIYKFHPGILRLVLFFRISFFPFFYIFKFDNMPDYFRMSYVLRTEIIRPHYFPGVLFDGTKNRLNMKYFNRCPFTTLFEFNLAPNLASILNAKTCTLFMH